MGLWNKITRGDKKYNSKTGSWEASKPRTLGNVVKKVEREQRQVKLAESKQRWGKRYKKVKKFGSQVENTGRKIDRWANRFDKPRKRTTTKRKKKKYYVKGGVAYPVARKKNPVQRNKVSIDSSNVGNDYFFGSKKQKKKGSIDKDYFF